MTFIWHSFCPWMFWSIYWRINLYFLGHFLKDGYISSHTCSCLHRFRLDKENLKLIAFVSLDLAGQTFSKSHTKTPLSQFPACTNYAFISRNLIWRTTNYIVRTFMLPQQDLFKKTVSNIMFLNCPRVRNLLYFFRKDKQCKFTFLLSLSLDLMINVIYLPYLDSWSNASSRQNLAEKPANFAGCRLLYTTLSITCCGVILTP